MPPTKTQPPKFLNRAIVVPLALVGLGVALWLGAATFITWHLLHPPFLDGGRGDVFVASETARANASLAHDPKSCCNAQFELVHVTDDAGASVDAWFVPGTLPSAILLIPAAGASKGAMLPYLQFLHSVGLPVLLIDSPDFVRARAGWGWGDRDMVRSAAATLRKRGFANVAALGISEGAAAALMVQGETPGTFDAIIADSSFTTLGAMLRRYPSLANLNPAFLETIMWELSRALGHNVEEISPQAAAAKLGHCALLVIQDDKDPITPESDGKQILLADGDVTTRDSYFARADGHGDALDADPQAYRKSVLDFIRSNLPGAENIVAH
jgi:pimeloyl-ACP methyl ester carboxylesterase